MRYFLPVILIVLFSTSCTSNDLCISLVDKTIVPPAGVKVFFTVKKCSGEPLQNRLKENEILVINNETQKSFESEGGKKPIPQRPSDTAYYTILVLDMSDSIFNNNQEKKLISATEGFIESIRTSKVILPEKHFVAIYAFGATVNSELVSDFTNQHGELIDKILPELQKKSRGGTNLYGAYMKSMDLLENVNILKEVKEELTFRSLIILSDGTHESGNAASLSKQAQEKLTRAKKRKTQIYSIGIKKADYDEEKIKELASKSENFFLIEDASGLSGVFDKVASNQQKLADSNYLLGICTPVESGNPSIVIKIKTAEGLYGELTIDYSTSELNGDVTKCDPEKLTTSRTNTSCADKDGDGYKDKTCGGNDCDDNDKSKWDNCKLVPPTCTDKDGDGHKDKACGGDDCNDNNKSEWSNCEPCPENKIKCSDICINTTNNKAHCGGCGNVCHTSCSNGACILPVLIAAGQQHTCVMTQKGTGYCWGKDNNSGRLGIITGENHHYPNKLGKLESITDITAGAAHTCVIAGQGSVLCWGVNGASQLGRQKTNMKYSSAPVQIHLRGVATKISSKNTHSCAIVEKMVLCWGSNLFGEIGNSSRSKDGVYQPYKILSIKDIIDISTGYNYSCAVDKLGTGYCWGKNDSGQLGLGKKGEDELAPRRIELKNIQRIWAGAYSTCALSDKKIYCWGGVYGLLPKAIPIKDIKDISISHSHICALTLEGNVFCWGENKYGELGNNSFVKSSNPVQVKNLQKIKALTTGFFHSCAIEENGSVLCWGQGSEGQLGNGRLENKSIPQKITNW